MNTKGLLAATETVIKPLKPQDNKQLDKNTYLNEIYKKLVNVNFDGASVMSGNNSGVQMKMKAKQGLFYTHCVVHCIELAVLDSIKGDPYLQEFDNGINKIFQFYFYSPTRRRELPDLAKILLGKFKQL